MIWLTLIGMYFSQIHALSKCASCKAVPRGMRPRVLDMDFLMDFHSPKGLGQQAGVAQSYQLPRNHEDRLEPSLFLPIPSTEHPKLVAGVVNSDKRVGTLPRLKNTSQVRKSHRPHADDIKRDFLSLLNSRKTRQAVQQPLDYHNHGNHLLSLDSSCVSSANDVKPPHTLAKRFYMTRNLHHRHKSRRFKVDRFGNITWTPWHVNGRLVNVTKRDTTSNRRKLSDFLTRAGFKKDKEEAIKVVLPLLLSDLKDTAPKSCDPMVVTNVEHVNIPVSGPLNVSQGRLRNFKVKGDDGKEFSFSASASDVQQLMDILSKPNSSVVLERVSPDKSHPLLKQQQQQQQSQDRNRTPGLKKTSSYHKGKESSSSDNTEVLLLKEVESAIYENVVQLDVPSRQSKTSTTPDAAPTRCCGTTAN